MNRFKSSEQCLKVTIIREPKDDSMAVGADSTQYRGGFSAVNRLKSDFKVEDIKKAIGREGRY